MKKIILEIVIAVLVMAGAWYWIQGREAGKQELQFVTDAYYSCAGGKQIKAMYYKEPETEVGPGEMPVPSGRVSLSFSDGRDMNLPQTISASGIRYASADELVVFWSKGDGAFVTENGAETFSNCAERVWKLGNESVDSAVRQFLLSQNILSWKTREVSKNFCVFQNLYPEKELFPVYLWVRCGEFMVEGGKLVEASGTSVPVKVDYPNELSYFDLGKFTLTVPRDGSLYSGDVKAIFPDEIQQRLNFESGPLNEKIKEEAMKYFAED